MVEMLEMYHGRKIMRRFCAHTVKNTNKILQRVVKSPKFQPPSDCAGMTTFANLVIKQQI